MAHGPNYFASWASGAANSGFKRVAPGTVYCYEEFVDGLGDGGVDGPGHSENPGPVHHGRLQTGKKALLRGAPGVAGGNRDRRRRGEEAPVAGL